MTRSRTRSAICAVAVWLTVGVATASFAVTARSAHGVSKSAFITRLVVETRGGFVPLGWDIPNPPQVVIADRTRFRPLVPSARPYPLLIPIESRTVAVPALVELTEAAYDLGLMDDTINWGTPDITDAPDTEVIITVGPSLTITHHVYALGTENGLSKKEKRRRANLEKFIALTLADSKAPLAGRLGPAVPFTPNRLRMWASDGGKGSTRALPAGFSIVANRCTGVTGTNAERFRVAAGGATQNDTWAATKDPQATAIEIRARYLMPGEPLCP